MSMREIEIFISTLLREQFDYTVWRQSMVDRIDTFEKLDKKVKDAKEITSFDSKPTVVL